MEPIGGISSFVLRYHFYSLLPSSLLLWALLVHFSYSINLIFSRGTGGPNNSTLTVVLLIYQYAFKRLDMGYAAALALMLALVIMIVTLIQRYWFYKKFKGYQVTVISFKGFYIQFLYAIITFLPLLGRFLPHLNAIRNCFRWNQFYSQQVTLENYQQIFSQEPLFGRWLFNSVFVAICVTGFNLLFNSMAGYALAKFSFRKSIVVFWF